MSIEIENGMEVIPDRPLPHKLPTPDMAVRQQSRGLGDTVAKITHATRVDELAKLYTQITGRPCGCAERQEALNKLFPYGVKEDIVD